MTEKTMLQNKSRCFMQVVSVRPAKQVLLKGRYAQDQARHDHNEGEAHLNL